MSVISRIWDKVVHTGTPVRASFPIPANHVVDSAVSTSEFRADQSYFELRLAEQFLKDKREYFYEYIPLTLALTGFIYNGKRRYFPFVVGPSLLQELEQLDGDERVRYRNTRLAGPTPYAGDGIDLFVGLFRVKTQDWARETLKLLESVARSFDASRLTEFVAVADPLADSIESFLRLDQDAQFRLGERIAYTDPTQNNSSTAFRSGYWAYVRADANQLDREQFWVKENQLHQGPDAGNLRLYRNHDYLLLSVNQMQMRTDYTTFDFHREWEKAQEAYWNSPVDNYDGAKTHMRALMYQIQSSPDLISDQRSTLLKYYYDKFIKEKQVRENMEGLGAGEQRPDGLPQVTEQAIEQVIANPAEISNIEPDPDAL